MPRPLGNCTARAMVLFCIALEEKCTLKMQYCCYFEWLTRWRLPERHENSLLQQMGTGFRVLVSDFISLSTFAAFCGWGFEYYSLGSQQIVCLLTHAIQLTEINCFYLPLRHFSDWRRLVSRWRLPWVDTLSASGTFNCIM